MQKVQYLVTGRAGPYIAGRRSPGAGHVIVLSTREAAHDLRVGALVPAPKKGRVRKGGRDARP